MRLSLRFVIPLLVALGIFAYAALPLVDRLMLRWFSRDLEVRANLIANTIEEPLQDLLRSGNRRRLTQFFEGLSQDERLLGLAFCPADKGEPIATPPLPTKVRAAVLKAFRAPPGDWLQPPRGPWPG